MNNTQASQLTVETSLYPKELQFKPKLISAPGVYHLERAFYEIIHAPIPPTKEDEEWERKWSARVRPGSCSDSFDDETTADWEQRHAYWVRVRQGPNPHCWTHSRVGATVRWRNAHGSYCCAGFPHFYQETMEMFRREMEMVKPVVYARIGSSTITLGMQRTLKGPYGTCWGIKTDNEFWTIDIDGEQQVVDNNPTAFHRALKPYYKPFSHAIHQKEIS